MCIRTTINSFDKLKYKLVNIARIANAVQVIEVASVIDRKGLARAGSWFIYLPAIDTIVTGLVQVTL